MSDTIIVDGNSIGHANHNGTVLTAGMFQTQAIFGFVKYLRALKEVSKGWNIIVLWDGHSAFRREIYSEYKANRVPKDEKERLHKEAYKVQVPYIQKAVQMLGVRQMVAFSAEADDMAGLIVKRLSSNNLIRLETGDQDWLMLVNENTVWHDPIRENTVGLTNFFKFTGFETQEAFLEGKALQGDISDFITGVGGIGETTAPQFLAEHKSVQAFFDKIDAGKYTPKTRKTKTAKTPHPEQALASPEGRALFLRNKRLMNLLDVPTPPPEDVKVWTPHLNKEGFRALCNRLAFQSITRGFDSFMKPFEGE